MTGREALPQPAPASAAQESRVEVAPPSVADFFLKSRPQRFEETRDEMVKSMRRLRVFLTIGFAVLAGNHLLNLVMQVVAMTRMGDSEAAFVLPFNLLLLAIDCLSISVFATKQQPSSLPLHLILVTHAILVFFEFMGVLSTLYPGFASLSTDFQNRTDPDHPDAEGALDRAFIGDKGSSADDRFFVVRQDVAYDVPSSLLACGFIYGFFHVLITVLVDHSRRMNAQLADLHHHHHAFGEDLEEEAQHASAKAVSQEAGSSARSLMRLASMPDASPQAGKSA